MNDVRRITAIIVCVMGLQTITQAQPCLEHEITQEAIENALNTIKQNPDDENDKATIQNNVSYGIDLNKVNSSSERPLIKFDAVEERINAIEQQVSALSLQLKALKDQLKELKATAQEIIDTKNQPIVPVSVQNITETLDQDTDLGDSEP